MNKKMFYKDRKVEVLKQDGKGNAAVLFEDSMELAVVKLSELKKRTSAIELAYETVAKDMGISVDQLNSYKALITTSKNISSVFTSRLV